MVGPPPSLQEAIKSLMVLQETHPHSYKREVNHKGTHVVFRTELGKGKAIGALNSVFLI